MAFSPLDCSTYFIKYTENTFSVYLYLKSLHVWLCWLLLSANLLVVSSFLVYFMWFFFFFSLWVHIPWNSEAWVEEEFLQKGSVVAFCQVSGSIANRELNSQVAGFGGQPTGTVNSCFKCTWGSACTYQFSKAVSSPYHINSWPNSGVKKCNFLGFPFSGQVDF